MAIFQKGSTWSGTSNINYNNGQDIANEREPARCSSGSPGQVAVLCGGAPTNVVLDVFAYYP